MYIYRSCKSLPWFYDGRISVVKIAILANLIYRFSKTCIKVSITFFVDLQRTVLKFIWKLKAKQLQQTFLKICYFHICVCLWVSMSLCAPLVCRCLQSRKHQRRQLWAAEVVFRAEPRSFATGKSETSPQAIKAILSQRTFLKISQ